MPSPYPPEFRARAIALVREGRQVKRTAQDFGIHEVTLHSWLRQDDVDHGRRPGRSSQESVELRAARGRVRQLEQEIAILRRAGGSTRREESTQKGAPGDRPARRRRSPRVYLLPPAGRFLSGLLPPVPEASRQRHRAPPPLADGRDPRDPRGLSRHLRLPPHSC